MTRYLSLYLVSVLIATCHCVSTKVDFFEDDRGSSSSTKDDEDVEVKHTIVVSTKLKNRNGGLHTSGEPQPLYLSRSHKQKDDSGEVPIIKAYKSVDTTAIHTPDTRLKTPASRTFNRNTRDGYDLYPNTALSPAWKPSSFYNNINYWTQDDFYNIARTINRQDSHGTLRYNNDARDFYCRKCRELSTKGCAQKTNAVFRESTTPNIKVDGKLAKLN